MKYTLTQGILPDTFRIINVLLHQLPGHLQGLLSQLAVLTIHHKIKVAVQEGLLQMRLMDHVLNLAHEFTVIPYTQFVERIRDIDPVLISQFTVHGQKDAVQHVIYDIIFFFISAGNKGISANSRRARIRQIDLRRRTHHMKQLLFSYLEPHQSIVPCYPLPEGIVSPHEIRSYLQLDRSLDHDHNSDRACAIMALLSGGHFTGVSFLFSLRFSV